MDAYHDGATDGSRPAASPGAGNDASVTQFLVRQLRRQGNRGGTEGEIEERQRVSGESPTYELIDALAASIYLCAAFSFQFLFFPLLF